MVWRGQGVISALLSLAEQWPPVQRYFSGIGSIIALHRVAAPEPSRLPVNEGLKLSPGVLEKMILTLKASGHQFVGMDGLWRDLQSGQAGPRRIAFTLDDGYLDNYTTAYPIFKKHGVPFTLYLTSSFPDQTARLWWFALEDILQAGEVLRLSNGMVFDTATVAARQAAFLAIRRLLVEPQPGGPLACLDALFADHGVDWLAYSRRYALSWAQVKTLSQDPLVTVGGHTASHASLSRLSPDTLVQEVVGAHRRISAVTGRPVEHFAYPFGGRKEAGPREFSLLKDLGLKTAVTTRRGNVYAAHKNHLTSLPRVSFENHWALQRLGRPTFPRVVTA
jgi:peptidoglycan/xylan/chitin deacetylase (PgdA/CDA1 family)